MNLTGQKITEREMSPKLAELSQLTEIGVGGETSIEGEVVATVASLATSETDGVSSLGDSSVRRAIVERVGATQSRARGVSVEAGRREAILDIDLRVVYGYSIPEVVIKVRENVAHRLLEVCGLIAKEVNVDVVGIDFPDRTPGRVD
jgi:uncharacterized alkaline shock family protein YloU